MPCMHVHLRVPMHRVSRKLAYLFLFVETLLFIHFVACKVHLHHCLTTSNTPELGK